MKKILIICAFTFVCASQAATNQSQLTVRTMKQEIKLDYTASTTIRALKTSLLDREGVPVEQQELIKEEGTAWGFPPKKVYTTLENSKTCAHYDLTPESIIHLWLTLRPRVAGQ